MGIKELQKGLLDWFRFEPNDCKTHVSTENICIKLFEQFYPNKEIRYAKYEIIYPLLRYGVIEFYGKKQFALSPTCCIIRDNSILAVNLPAEISQIIVNEMVFDTDLGIELYKNSNNTFSILKKKSVVCVNFYFSRLLREVISFEKIIQGWTRDNVFETNGFQFFDINHKWRSNCDKLSFGIYKKSSEFFSQKTFKLDENNWHLIPSISENIDAFYIAVCWASCIRNENIEIKYISKESKLIIKNTFFPIILERLLFLNTVLAGKFLSEVYDRHYLLYQSDFEILNKLMNYNISIE